MDRLDKTVLEQWLQLPAESSMNYPPIKIGTKTLNH